MLGDIVGFVGGNGFPERFQGACHGDIPFFKVSDMSLAGNERFLTRANNYVSRELAASRNWSVVPAGGVAFAKVGAALLLNRRRIMTSDALVDNNMMAAVPGTEVHPTWLYWWLQTVDFGLFVQPGALPSVNQGHLRSLRVFLPHYSEQSRIAVVLNTVDEAIAKTEAVIAKLKQVRAGLLHDLLTHGLDLSACEAQAGEHGQLRDPIAHPEQFKNSPLGRLPRAWHLTTLIEACLKIADRDHTTPVYVAEGVRMLSPTHFVGDDEIDFEACPRISVEAHLQNRAKTDLAVDDVIIHRIGAGLGRVRLVEAGMPEFSILHSLAMIRPRPHCLRSGFLYWAIQADVIQVQMGLGTQSIGVPDLGLDKIGGVLMAIPPLGEQERIADLLNILATNVRAELRLLQKLNCLKSGLMNDLLTGRVRVPESISAGDSQS